MRNTFRKNFNSIIQKSINSCKSTLKCKHFYRWTCCSIKTTSWPSVMRLSLYYMRNPSRSQDMVEDSVDVSNVHFTITIHVGSRNRAISQDDFDNRIHVSDIHLSIDINISNNY